MADVPLSGTGRIAKATDLPRKQSGKFFTFDLDSPNHLEIIAENSAVKQRIRALRTVYDSQIAAYRAVVAILRAS